MNAVEKFFLCFMFLTLLPISCSKESTTEDFIEELETPLSETGSKTRAQLLYTDFYLASATTDNAAWSGDASSCNPGTVPQATRTKILMRIDYFRKAVGLENSIMENATKNEKAQKAALMMHSNNALDHAPPNSWKCYSPEGKEGASNSLLTLINNERAIDSYMRDHGIHNGPVGHRRWLLWPRLQEIGIGNTSEANAIWVLGNAGDVPENTPEFVSWPPSGYVPRNLVYPRWSFSLQDANFEDTQVSMKDEFGNTIPLTLEQLDNAYGDRTIVWVPNTIQTALSEDVSYTVLLKDVEVNEEFKDFTYSVTLFDPED
ncbi:MAG: CAP domain-containing protein [Bacteroidota bacterium]